MKRNTFLKAALGATMICSIASTAVLASPDHDHGTKETKAEVKHDAKAIKIIEKFIEKSGGREKIEENTSMHTTGSMNFPSAGLSGSMEIFTAEGGNLFIKINIPGFGEQLQGLRDGIGWSIDPMGGPKLLDEEQAQALLDQSDPQIALKYADRYSAITYAGEAEFDGKDVHQIDYVSIDNGRESTEFYSIETGLLVGSTIVTPSEMGDITITSTINEYAEFDGVMVPTKLTQKMATMSFVITVDSAEFNKVDKSVFEYPAAIKALIEASKEDD